MGYGNFIAEIALWLWLPLGVLAFSVLRPTLATAAVLLGGVLLLPNNIQYDLPMLPPFGKTESASIAVLLACVIYLPGRLMKSRPGRGVESLLLVLVAAGFATAATNGDAQIFGSTVLPGLTLYEGVSMGVRTLLSFGVPYFIGRLLFASPRALKDLYLVLVIAALVYTLFILVELRMSPQFHRWVYGTHTGGFLGRLRYGGYQPVVFMSNGLALSAFLAFAAVAAAALARARIPILGLPTGIVSGWLCVILVLCKSLASTIYALVGVPLVALAKPALQVRAASLLCAIALIYPIPRMLDVVPDEQILEVAGLIHPERAHSLGYRFNMERMLANRAGERLLWGWGGHSRSRVYDETGRDISVSDGYWVIQLGQRGLVGLFCVYGMMTLPVFLAWRRLGRIRSRTDRRLVASLALIVAFACIDSIPNAFFNYIPTLMAGALLGIVGKLPARRRHAAGARPRRSPAVRAAAREPAVEGA